MIGSVATQGYGSVDCCCRSGSGGSGRSTGGFRQDRPDVELCCQARDGGYRSCVAGGSVPRANDPMGDSGVDVPGAVLWTQAARIYLCRCLHIRSDCAMGSSDVLLGRAVLRMTGGRPLGTELLQTEGSRAVAKHCFVCTGGQQWHSQAGGTSLGGDYSDHERREYNNTRGYASDRPSSREGRHNVWVIQKTRDARHRVWLRTTS
jgi:hypothetical protein